MQKQIVVTLMICLLAGGSWCFGQAAGTAGRSTDWQVGFVSGYFTGGTFLRTYIDAEPVKAKTEDGFLVGIRGGADSEYLGWEVTAAGVFYDMELEADSAADLPSVSDAWMFLGGVNGLWFPTGNEMADGRIRPFLTAGPGLAYFSSDYDQADNETMFDMNVGGGIKFLLGDDGNPVLRIDYRWYYFVGSTAGLENQMYRQEISVGLGIRF